MNAVIRFTKKVLLNDSTTDPDLKQTFSGIMGNALSDFSTFSIGNIKDLENNATLFAKFNYEANQYVPFLVQTFREKLPPAILCELEKFKIKSHSTKIVAYDSTQPMSLKVEINFVSQPFTLLQVIGETMVLVEGDKSADIDAGLEIKEVFQLKLTDDMFISHYKTMNTL